MKAPRIPRQPYAEVTYFVYAIAVLGLIILAWSIFHGGNK